MEPFVITIADKHLSVKPRLDNAFDIFENDRKLGTVQPIVVNEATVWTSKEIDKDYAQQIGELIEEHKL